MRLIDVSKLKKIRIEHQRSVYSHGRIEGYNACIEDLENQPEVKAIPVEWIKKWCNEQNRKSLEERLLKRYGVITMLEDWEKEK